MIHYGRWIGRETNCTHYVSYLFKALSNLVELDLSYNKISSLGSNLNTKLGNVKRLNLAGNELDSVEGTVR